MKSSRVYITDYITNPDVEGKILGEELGERPNNKTEVLVVWHEHIDSEYIDRFPNLKGIVRYGVGFDNIDIDYARSKNIDVCNTPDYGTEEVSDTAMAMVLNITRGITRYDYLCRGYSDDWQENTIKTIKRTSEQKLGVIGAGRIGGSIILRANAQLFKTVFFDPYKPCGYEKMLGAERVNSLPELLAASDIISINAPLTDETRNLVNKGFVAKMKVGASLVNTARGQIIGDIDVFYEPLRDNHLNCVALDVLPEEPPKDSRLIRAWKSREKWLDGRLIINPHTAYYSEQALQEMRCKAATNAKRIIAGMMPLNIVNK